MSHNKEHRHSELRMIPLDRIEVLNPRERNSRVFEQIVGNIQNIGLKKPIIVTPRPGSNGEHYLLICGEGRFKAFKTLGHQEIPAMVMNVDDESAFIMSLTENIARRKFSPLELLSGIELLRDQGYDKKSIAQKTGLSPEYVQGILQLLQNGEQRLLMAVGSGRITLRLRRGMAGAGRTVHVLWWWDHVHSLGTVCSASSGRSGRAGERAVLGGLQVGNAAGRAVHADPFHARSGQGVRSALVVQGGRGGRRKDHAARRPEERQAN